LARTKRTNNKKLSNEELLKKAELQKRLLEETPETEELKVLPKPFMIAFLFSALSIMSNGTIGTFRETKLV